MRRNRCSPPLGRQFGPAGREEGVTCVSCHLEQGVLSGPLEPTGKVHPHPIGVRPEVYYEQRHLRPMPRGHDGPVECRSGSEKRTCQQCHMEPVTRKVTQATGGISNLLVAMEKEVPVDATSSAFRPPPHPLDTLRSRAGRSGSGVESRLRTAAPMISPRGILAFGSSRWRSLRLTAGERHRWRGGGN